MTMQCNDEREDGNLGVITTNALMTIPERANRVVRLGSFQGSGSCLKDKSEMFSYDDTYDDDDANADDKYDDDDLTRILPGKPLLPESD